MKSKASSSLGLKYIEELVPSSDYEEVKYMQQETSETQSILTKRGYVGLQGIHDIEDKVKRAGVGASLDPGSLIMIADTLRAARTLRNSLSGSDEEDFNYPIIQSLSNGLYAYREIEDAIYNAIISELEISDNASSTLRDIRRRIVQKNQSIRSKLNSIISSTTYQKYLQAATSLYEEDRDIYLRKAIEASYAKFQENKMFNGNQSLSLDKVVDVIRYFAASLNVTKLYKVKLMKLMWYADVLSYKMRGFAITGLVYQALPMGAVPIGHNSIIDLKDVPCEEVDMGETYAYHFALTGKQSFLSLSDEDKKILDIVIEKLGKMSKNDIINFMHRERAYIETTPRDIIEFKYAENLQI